MCWDFVADFIRFLAWLIGCSLVARVFLCGNADLSSPQDAYFNNEAGWCRADAATTNFMDAGVKKGVKRLTAEVSELVYEAGAMSGVKTADGQHVKADKVLLAAGAWTSHLLSPVEDALDLADNDRVERQVTAVGQVSAYYTVSETESARLADGKSRTPVIVYGNQGEMVPPSGGNKTIKVTNYRNFSNHVQTKSGRKITAPPGADGKQSEVPDQLKRETEELAVKIMPEYVKGKKPSGWRICWDAYTPTQDWLACRHPHEKLKNLYIATGGSFHGYKCVHPSSPYSFSIIRKSRLSMHLGFFLIVGSTF